MKKVFITGASSGIGKALALAYAKRGYSVGLTARREDILQDVAQACEKLGGIPFVYQLDVQDAEKCKSVADQFMADTGSIDIAIANAGIGGDDGLFSGDSNQINTILSTNILGVTNTLIPFIPAMKAQNSGALVCISSVASFMPLPFHGGYSSSKIAIRMIFDSWRPTLQKYMIKTVSICPGFVDTPIVKGPARRFPMKSAEDAAEQFLKVIDLGYSTYIYPWPYRILVLIVQLTPERFYNWLIKKMFGKPIT
ncbi:MAG: SDR family NAD(P)-dependent oxidoreductase [Candidatus Marinimicrobia bacterium]|nr:SDR family NAD(P)-dependent oxidoreductase [Candidatus Neomarinimicrobiota bacterium]MBT3848400.1 SDR family NAD(P)-dependent oxidoreductase [Candidatus Neomarinimicrobiota bacterium]MBT4053882.1 SDR family NAD(P)-dependent oxidoreductase [Candidatus Neomarinimicrobiota bacterium]MBT4370796.1 SDR family NAD(P)-dependent oxidoreductase [Candidatus Neomarinimicrobiota bacterium]MBT4661485.1 SDR family NAD(P)-dependent oxidoreductase [Candidatus Neomarinimicrobiota bacterium]